MVIVLRHSIRMIRTETYNNFCTNRVIRLWNNLPVAIKSIELSDMGTNSTFNRELKNHYKMLLCDNFNQNNVCTWVSVCTCVMCWP